MAHFPTTSLSLCHKTANIRKDLSKGWAGESFRKQGKAPEFALCCTHFLPAAEGCVLGLPSVSPLGYNPHGNAVWQLVIASVIDTKYLANAVW